MRHITTIIVFAVVSPTMTWGPDGHRIVGEIAFQELNQDARAEVIRLISLDPRYGRFNESCNWADHIKSDATWNWAKSLHYTNIDGTIGESESQVKTFKATRDCTSDTDCPDGTPCPTNACVVEAITYYSDVLGDAHASDDEKLMALKFLGHFVGDLHQPLHAGYKRDKGGNDKRVSFFNQRTNLHKVWDSMMLKREVTDWFAFATTLHGDITPAIRSTWSSDLTPEPGPTNRTPFVPGSTGPSPPAERSATHSKPT